MSRKTKVFSITQITILSVLLISLVIITIMFQNPKKQERAEAYSCCQGSITCNAILDFYPCLRSGFGCTWSCTTPTLTPKPTITPSPTPTPSPNRPIFFSPNYKYLPSSSYNPYMIKPKIIIIHWDGQSNTNVNYWKTLSTYNGLLSKGTSAHFAVGSDGVLQLLPMSYSYVQSSWGAFGREDTSINIEMAGSYFSQRAPSATEFNATVTLLKQLCTQYKLTLDSLKPHSTEDTITYDHDTHSFTNTACSPADSSTTCYPCNPGSTNVPTGCFEPSSDCCYDRGKDDIDMTYFNKIKTAIQNIGGCN